MNWASMIPIAATALVGADDPSKPSATVDGHLIRVDKSSSNFAQVGPDGRPGKQLTLTFAVEPKDASKSFAYEVGQRFVVRDATEKEIPIGRMHGSMSREPAFRLAGFPSTVDPNDRSGFRNALSVTISLQTDAATIATLEGDLFVSDVEILEFTFSKGELTPNSIKTIGQAEAKLFLFDEEDHGSSIGFKLKLPMRSRPQVLTGGGGSMRDHLLLFASDGGRKLSVQRSGYSGGSFGVQSDEDSRERIQREFSGVKLDRAPDALHLVVPQIECPRRLQFQLKDIPIPPPPPQPQPQPKKIALRD